MGGREPGGGQEQGWRLGAIPAPWGPGRAAGGLSGPYVRRARSWPLGHRLPCRERNVCRGSGRRAPGAVTVVCAAESRRPRGTASEAAREPRLPRTPRMRVTRSLTVRAEVFRRAAQTPRLWHGADAPVRPACPEAGGWAVRPADTRGQVAPPGAASLCREPRSRSPPPALPLLGLASRYCVRGLCPHL